MSYPTILLACYHHLLPTAGLLISNFASQTHTLHCSQSNFSNTQIWLYHLPFSLVCAPTTKRKSKSLSIVKVSVRPVSCLPQELHLPACTVLLSASESLWMFFPLSRALFFLLPILLGFHSNKPFSRKHFLASNLGQITPFSTFIPHYIFIYMFIIIIKCAIICLKSVS